MTFLKWYYRRNKALVVGIIASITVICWVLAVFILPVPYDFYLVRITILAGMGVVAKLTIIDHFISEYKRYEKIKFDRLRE